MSFSEEPVGVFTSPSPNHPNTIAFRIADLIRQEGNLLIVRGVGVLDGIPLLDIKAYFTALDSIPNATNAHTPTNGATVEEKMPNG
ncbi:MAG: TrmO family methyltransferase [Anaerolineales bacterium]